MPYLLNLINLEEIYCKNNLLPYYSLKGYLEWHKINYPWEWNSKKYNL